MKLESWTVLGAIFFCVSIVVGLLLGFAITALNVAPETMDVASFILIPLSIDSIGIALIITMIEWAIIGNTLYVWSKKVKLAPNIRLLGCILIWALAIHFITSTFELYGFMIFALFAWTYLDITLRIGEMMKIKLR